MSVTRNHQAECKHWQPKFTKIVEGKPVRFRDVCVHTFLMSDVDDPEIYAAGPILKWQDSDQGQWITANAADRPYWVQHLDYNIMGYQYKIMARLSEQNETFWRLKWGTTK
jgi:hypothetical protein